ncbi:protein 4.1b isoform X1 [Alosa sapidissima]|uniref:protein 4.1b isoform X1 n=1 Tax=Alosa sapidissima TaxID=34773 RepID=UPI001C0819BE|nr:protein 4.1b isoform X1 [Alosa sapidissima]XP_041962950.1 protein 4.1b isoform X1 [Alosa sapidissima]
MLCTVLFLDGSVREWNLLSSAIGQELFDEVCDHLNLLERDYFGLAIFDSPSTKTWLDVSKQISKQFKSIHAQFAFSVKFYPPNPAQLCEDLTRYLLCLQIRRDLLTRRLPCQSVTLIALGSCVLQSEFGPYDPVRHGDTYTNNLYLAPNQNEELLKRMREQHATYGSMSPAQADLLFLQNASQLPMYGIDRHPAKDSDGEDVVLGVNSEGILLYRDDMVESKYLWPRVLKISYKHSKFFIRTHPSEGSVWTLCFTLASNRVCKSLWKVATEHHSFFRLPSVEISRRRLLALRTQFRYRGRTEAESLQASSEIARSKPAFPRKLTARSTSLDILTHTSQPEPDDWFLMLDSIPPKALYTKANTEISQEDLEQDAEDPCDGSVEGEAQEDEVMEEVAEDEEIMEEKTEAIQQEGEILEIRQVKEVKIVRKITREVRTVGGQLKESKDLDILEEREEREAYESGVLKERLRQGGTVDQRLQGMCIPWKDVQRDDWYILFDKQPPMFYPTFAVKQSRILDQQQELVARITKLEGLDIYGEAEQEWEIVEEPQEKIVEEGELEGETVEIRRQKFKIIRKRMQEVMVEEEELPLQEDIVDEIQQQIEAIQEHLEELVEVEEQQLELEVLKERLQEVDLLEYKVQQMEQQTNVETTVDDWFFLLDKLPYIIHSAPLAVQSSVDEKESLEMAEMGQRTEEAVFITRERSEERVVKEGMEESVVNIETGVITEPITLQNNTYSVRDIDDDWFLLLEPVPLEARLTVGDVEPYTTGPIYEPEQERMLEEESSDEEEIVEGLDVSETTVEQIALEKTEPVVRYIEDDWFTLFDQVFVPIKTPPPVVWETLEGPAGISTISVEMKDEEERDEEMMEEWTQRPKPEVVEFSRVQEPTPTFAPRDVEDDWYSELEIPHKETVRVVEPYTMETRREVEVYQSEEGTSFESTTVITKEMTTLVTITEERREMKVTIMEERDVYAESPGDYITLEVKPPVAVWHVVDDWFMLLEPTPVEVKPSPAVSWEQEPAVPAEEQTDGERMVRMEKRTETQEQRMVEVKEVQPVIQEQRPTFTPREVENDWYTLLDVPPKETVWVAPQYVEETQVREREEVERTVKRVRISKEEVVVIEEREEPAQRPAVVIQERPVVPREIEDDWFLLMESVPVEVKTQPPVWATKRLVREREEVERTVKRVRISEEEVVVIEEREEAAQRPAVVIQERPVVPREIEDDWFSLMESVPVDVKTPPSVAWERMQPPPEVSRVTVDTRAKQEEERIRVEEMRVMEREMKGVQPTIQQLTPTFTPREVDDVWYTLLEVLPRETVGVKEDVMKTVRREERVTERVTIIEEQRVVIEKPTVQVQPQMQQPAVVREIDDDWFKLLDAVPLQERSVPSVEMRRPVDVSKTKMVERPRPEKEKERLGEQEIQRVPQKIFVGVWEIEDDWFKLWDKTILHADTRAAVVSKPAEHRAVERERIERGGVRERERVKEEDMRKRVTITEVTRVRTVQERAPPAVRHIDDDWYILLDKVSVEYPAPPRVAPVIPPTPAKRPVPVDQPLTSTPTTHPAPIIKYTPEVKRQETQVIVEEKTKEDEELTLIRRKTQRIVGENIYIRHSILMLEDFDVTQEVVLRRRASINELKRIFLEAEPEYHLSEWDKHLSICHLDTHTQLISMEEWSRESVSIM